MIFRLRGGNKMGFIERLRYRIRRFFAKEYVASVCGHTTYKIGKFSNGHIISMPKTPKTPEYCIECLEKMSIPCANCGEMIEIGDFVILVGFTDGHNPVEGAVQYENAYLAGLCCAELGMIDAQGQWIPSDIENFKGMVFRFSNITEQLLASGADCAVCN